MDANSDELSDAGDEFDDDMAGGLGASNSQKGPLKNDALEIDPKAFDRR